MRKQIFNTGRQGHRGLMVSELDKGLHVKLKRVSLELGLAMASRCFARKAMS